VPLYGDTLEDVRRFKEDPALPFNAFGTLAMARAEFDNNSASSQWFFLLKESDLTPSGTNILDGRYAVFGYAVEDAELLRDVRVGDTIDSIQVISGRDKLVNAYGG
jgi:cyclophilin family peptidyl-prolyl cis-trans isomerase